jgi:hypothetical protein
MGCHAKILQSAPAAKGQGRPPREESLPVNQIARSARLSFRDRQVYNSPFSRAALRPAPTALLQLGWQSN